MELILFAARAKRHRPELAKRLRALVTEIITVTSRATGRADLDPAWAGTMLLALEDSFRPIGSSTQTRRQRRASCGR
jgi:hypothetical protein